MNAKLDNLVDSLELPKKLLLITVSIITSVISLITLGLVWGSSIIICVLIITYIVFSRIDKNYSISGIVQFFSKRKKLSDDWWEEYYSPNKKPKNVLIMAQSINKLFINNNISDALVQWCNHGAYIRILFLSPDNVELSQLHYVGMGMHHSISDDPANNLRKKIYESIDLLKTKVSSKIEHNHNKPHVRFATRDLPYSIVSIDDEMVVTLYGVGAEGNDQPTMIVNGSKSKAHKRFKEEFETIWSEYSKVYPYVNPLIKYFRKDWLTNFTKYFSLKDYDVKIPLPEQVIFFPTYRCTKECSYCSFQETRKQSKPHELKPDRFEKILTELIRLGIKKFEISGGGEPLEHNEFNEILAIIKTFHQKKSNLKFGLLTNGYSINNYDPKTLLTCFNEYIRCSHYESIENINSNELKVWQDNLKALLKEKRKLKLNTKIGLKYLLTSDNKKKILKIVENDLKDSDLRNVDYMRFTSDREVDRADAIKIEQDLYNLLIEQKIPHLKDNISLSLPKLLYPLNHRCWMSPISVVIDPNEDMYMCCNYLHDKNAKNIGNLDSGGSFITQWRSEYHNKKRKMIRKENCSQDCYVSCRFAQMQELFERTILPME